MLQDTRNAKFEEYYGLIDAVMRKNYGLIKMCGIAEDDVHQDLSIRMLEALGRYDSALNPNITAYLKQQLKYELLGMAAPSKRFGIPGAPRKKPFSVLSLDAENAQGQSIIIPCSDESPSTIWLKDEIAALPDNQRAAILNRLVGKRTHCDNKALRSAQRNIRTKMDDIGLSILPERREGTACA